MSGKLEKEISCPYDFDSEYRDPELKKALKKNPKTKFLEKHDIYSLGHFLYDIFKEYLEPFID